MKEFSIRLIKSLKKYISPCEKGLRYLSIPQYGINRLPIPKEFIMIDDEGYLIYSENDLNGVKSITLFNTSPKIIKPNKFPNTIKDIKDIIFGSNVISIGIKKKKAVSLSISYITNVDEEAEEDFIFYDTIKNWSKDVNWLEFGEYEDDNGWYIFNGKKLVHKKNKEEG